MATGIVLSGVMAYIALNTEYFKFIFESSAIFYGLIAVELVIVLGVQFMIRKITPKMAGILFFLYAAITGILSSVLFAMYNLNSIMVIFAAAVAMYAVLAIIGFRTKKDISGWGIFLFVGMVGVIIASVINIFLQNGMFDIIVSIIAILVFAGFTVYDQQVYKNMYQQIKGNQEEIDRYTVLGALHMYINLIVMFQSLLRLFGDKD
jgi:FtsH-binding integral membrane protein